MSRPPTNNKAHTKDMYWFAHGGIESSTDKCLNQKNSTPGECEEETSDSNSPTVRCLTDRRSLPDEQKSPFCINSVDSGNSSGPSSLEINDRTRNLDKHIAAEERRKQLWEAEQERNDAVLRKHLERGAALEARRNAQRSTISFAFGSSIPRNVESLQSGDSEKISRHSNASGLLHKGDDVMSRSMTAAVPAPRGRRKNDLMPTVPYDRTATPKSSSSGTTRKRSVSMTRLDQLAQPRRHYVEANKANSTVSSGALSHKDNIKSPTRPLSSASEQSGGSGRLGGSATRRLRSSPRKPRPVSIAGTVPDHKSPTEIKVSPLKKSGSSKKPEAKKATTPVANKQTSAKSTEKSKSAEKPKPSVEKTKPVSRSTSTLKCTKQPSVKPTATPLKASSPKAPTSKKTVTNKKKADIMTSSLTPAEIIDDLPADASKSISPPPASPPPESSAADTERNNAKRIISEEEAKAALAEKRRLAREQAEREAELERQRQEELRQQEEERLRLEEEEQRRMEEEQLHLLEEHRKLEEEKLRKAIEENERKEEEERQKREEEQRLKAEQEKKAQEEAEKQRIELEEKLRKEEEERAERKKRLEKIMSRTRGKTSGTSPSGSVSGSEHFDSSENQQENVSSGANSLDSTGTGEIASEPASLECSHEKSEPVSDGASMEANPTYEVTSDNESLNDIVMPRSETASQDNSLVIIPAKDELSQLVEPHVDSTSTSSETLQLQTETVVSAVELTEQNDVHVADESVKEDTENEMIQDKHRVEDLNSEIAHLEEEHQTDDLNNEAVHLEEENVKHLEEHQTDDLNNEAVHLEEENVKHLAEHQTDDLNNEAVHLEEENVKHLEEHQTDDLNSEAVHLEEENVKHLEEHQADDLNSEAVHLEEENVKTKIVNETQNNEPIQEAFEEISSSDVSVLETTQFTSTPLESSVVDHAEVILSFEQEENMEVSVTDHIDTPRVPKLNISQTFDEYANGQVEMEDIEQNSHFSASSDIKLPDPIYETSEDGSVSSEKHQQEFGFNEDHNHHESQGVADEVFNEKEYEVSEKMYQNLSPFETQDIDTSASNMMAAYESQFEVGGMQDSIYVYETSNDVSNVIEQPREIGEENVYATMSSCSIPQCVEDLGNSQFNTDVFLDYDGNKENVCTERENSSQNTNPFVADNFSEHKYEADKENIHFNTYVEVPEVSEGYTFPESTNEINHSQAPDSCVGEFYTQQQYNVFEQTNFESQPVLGNSSIITSDSFKFSDVTIIKAEDNGDCIGIISSIDSDHISNDLAQKSMQNELLKSNFEYSSITDSEDSSLDSNLSQVMTVEVSEKNSVGFNQIEKVSSESTVIVSNNQEVPFNEGVNGNSNSNSNGDHYPESEVLSNGHRLESADPNLEQISDFVQLDSKHISSVDHSKNNIFDNVDAVDFGKMTPDPFLAKGPSSPISGNPFLIPDDQKQVLMTPDFFN